ncbi:unnamed protein product, partial [Polarella glacialis]
LEGSGRGQSKSDGMPNLVLQPAAQQQRQQQQQQQRPQQQQQRPLARTRADGKSPESPVYNASTSWVASLAGLREVQKAGRVPRRVDYSRTISACAKVQRWAR